MLINKAYKLALYPNGRQVERLLAIAGACRFVWNHYLQARTEAWLQGGKSMTYPACAKDLTRFKKQPDTEWLDALPVHPLQQSLRDLDVAYNRFFRKVARLPKFKGRKDSVQSFRMPVGWRIRDNKIQLEKDNLLRARGTFPPDDAKLRSLTIKMDNGRWYAIILTEQEINTEAKTGAAVGYDLGLTDLLVDSNGKRYPNPKPRKAGQRSIKRASQTLARRQRGSHRRAKAKQELMRLHRKVAFQRMNHLHQVTHRITSENQAVIVCEDLAVKNMLRNHRLAGSIADAAWGELLRQLEYKQLWRGGKLVRIDRFFPSSKTCSACGHLLKSLPLSIRRWACPKCEEVHDRDVNAAKVILQQYLAEERLGVEGKESSRRKAVMVACPKKRRHHTGELLCSPRR